MGKARDNRVVQRMTVMAPVDIEVMADGQTVASVQKNQLRAVAGDVVDGINDDENPNEGNDFAEELEDPDLEGEEEDFDGDDPDDPDYDGDPEEEDPDDEDDDEDDDDEDLDDLDEDLDDYDDDDN